MCYTNIKIPHSVLTAPRVKQQSEIDADLAAYREAFKQKCMETGHAQKKDAEEKLKWAKTPEEKHRLLIRWYMGHYLQTQLWVPVPPRGGLKGWMSGY